MGNHVQQDSYYEEAEARVAEVDLQEERQQYGDDYADPLFDREGLEIQDEPFACGSQTLLFFCHRHLVTGGLLKPDCGINRAPRSFEPPVVPSCRHYGYIGELCWGHHGHPDPCMSRLREERTHRRRGREFLLHALRGPLRGPGYRERHPHRTGRGAGA